MGLSLNYQLRARKEVASADIPRVVAAMRERVLSKLGSDFGMKVSVVSSGPEALFWHSEWLQVRVLNEENTIRGIEVPAIEGYVFAVDLGEDCESLRLGLCRYPEQVTDAATGKLRSVRMRGWRLSCSCKTQYSSLHGWENFRRIHIAAVEMLVELRSLGVEVKINDEGGYWPGRDIAELRRRIDRMNGLTAALAGALKDDADERAAPPLQAPILAHPDFEHLEATAIENEKGALSQAVNLLKQQRPPNRNVT